MITSGQLTLSLSQVERTTVSLSVTCYEEYEESKDSWNMTLDDQPVPSTSLSLNDTAHLHGAGKNNCRNQTETERHLVRNHLYGTTHG